jgi:hypothetical protein
MATSRLINNSARLCLFLIVVVCLTGLAGCRQTETKKEASAERMNQIAESYVKLVLAVGQHDADYVDAFYGPQEWRSEAEKQKQPLGEIRGRALKLLSELNQVESASQDELARLRHQYLLKQLQSLVSRVEMLEGKKLSFDEETKALYDTVAPTFPESHFKQIQAKLESKLPGSGTLMERYDGYRQAFVIPKDKLDLVFKTAIDEARRRTRKHISLPENENFVVEYVTDKSWSGYNWYKGNSYSLIQINTDLPIHIDRAVDLAAHEGYPGHHVYNVLLEDRLVKGRGWIEFTVYPLFSPQSLISEGSANFGIDVAFPGQERVAFERDVLFPLAGIDPGKTENYYEISKLVAELNFAVNEAARRYLNGEIGAEGAVSWLAQYALTPSDRARQRVRFIDQYRSYVINYNLGQELVKKYIEGKGGTTDNLEKRWTEFEKLLSSPRLPSGLT